jgi:hypothetical protein
MVLRLPRLCAIPTPVRLLGHGTAHIVDIISINIACHDAPGHQQHPSQLQCAHYPGQSAATHPTVRTTLL